MTGADQQSWQERRFPLVGREREQTQLRAYLADALQGRGSLALVGGEAGIGKTTLVEHLAREAVEQGFLVRTGYCYDHSITQAYAPWIDSGLFGRWDSAPEVTPEQQRIIDLLKQSGPAAPSDVAVSLGIAPEDADGLLRRMAENALLVRTGTNHYNLVGVRVGGASDASGDVASRPGSIHRGDDFSSAEHQVVLFEQVQEYLEGVAGQQPLLLILEDFHWADSASVELLRFIARQLATLRILLVVTYRNDEMTRHQPLYRYLPVLVREASPHRINLRRLDVAGIRSLVAAWYQLPKAEETRLVTYLNRLAEGNPFFASELLWMLEEQQSLLQTATGWQLGALDLAQHVPQLLRQLVDGRVARLSEDARDLLHVAAVIGQEVPLDLWQRASAMTDEQLASTVEQALDAHLLEESPGGAGVRFRHALIREALYEDLVMPRQRIWHRRIAETMTEMPKPDPSAVAHHFQQAGDPRAAEWWIRAGEAAQRTAWLTAAECFEAALPLLDEQGADARERGWLLVRMAQLRRFADPQLTLSYLDEAARLAVDGDDRVLAACTRFYRGDRYFLMGEVRRGMIEQEAGVAAFDALSADEVAWFRDLVTSERWPDEGPPPAVLVARLANLGRFAEARDLAFRQIADTSAPEAIEEHDIAQILQIGVPVYSGLAEVYASAGQPVKSQLAFAQSREGYRAIHNHTLVGSAVLRELLWVVLTYHTDNLDERRRVTSEGEEAWKRAGGAQGGWTPRMTYLPTLLLDGQWDEAHRLAEASLATRRTSFRREVTLNTLGWLKYYQGDTERAWTLVLEMFDEGADSEPGNVNYVTALGMQRLAVTLALDSNDLETARDWLLANDRWLSWNGCLPGRAEGRLLWARYHRAVGDKQQALACAEEALELASRPRQPLALLSAQRCLGELKTALGQLPEAEAHLSASLTLARACAAPYEEALTLLTRAEWQIATGSDVETARETLGLVNGICRQLGAEPALQHAAQLESRLAEQAHPVTDERSLLSARELDVLRLVAEGLTDGQVAEQLYISPRTVGHHLRSIYNKLGVSSRAAAVRRALEEKLI